MTTLDDTDHLTIDPVPSHVPTELPDWLDTQRDLRDAVMAHPADQITRALAATGTTDLATLLGHLVTEANRVTAEAAAARAADEAETARTCELAAITTEIRAVARTRRTSLLPALADRIEALTHTTDTQEDPR